MMTSQKLANPKVGSLPLIRSTKNFPWLLTCGQDGGCIVNKDFSFKLS